VNGGDFDLKTPEFVVKKTQLLSRGCPCLPGRSLSELPKSEMSFRKTGKTAPISPEIWPQTALRRTRGRGGEKSRRRGRVEVERLDNHPRGLDNPTAAPSEIYLGSEGGIDRKSIVPTRGTAGDLSRGKNLRGEKSRRSRREGRSRTPKSSRVEPKSSRSRSRDKSWLAALAAVGLLVASPALSLKCTEKRFSVMQSFVRKWAFFVMCFCFKDRHLG